MTTHSFFRLPPDGVGKRLSAEFISVVPYDNGTIDFNVGDVVTGLTSGATGPILHVVGTTTSGVLFVDTDGIYANDEQLHVGGVQRALANGDSYYQFTQNVALSGGNNPLHSQYIDNRGQAFVRFAEGTPQFDSFGSTKTSQATTLADYKHDRHAEASSFSVNLAVGGQVNYVEDESSTILSVTGSTGSSAIRTTNRYHRYFPGSGTLVEMTVACGDSGKANNYRAWGYFDQDNGVFFKLNGTQLSVVQRSSTSGTPVDVEIPQSSWNTDKGDGTGLSGMAIDITKLNIWWIDVQWLGAGRARFGVYSPEGDRVVLHQSRNANSLPVPYMSTATLPVRYENVNTGTTGSSSELRTVCATVKVESNIYPFFENYSGGAREALTLGASLVPVTAIRPKLLAGPQNRINRRHVQPLSVSVCLTGTGPALIQIVENTTLTDATWAALTSGNVEADIAATAYSGGNVVWSSMLTPGSHLIDLATVYDVTSDTLRLTADEQQTSNVTVVAKGLGGSTPAISAVFNWQELI